MPSVEWNKIWAQNFKTFSRGKLANQAEHYGDQWGLPENKPHLKRLVDEYIEPYLNSEHVALEIGSGGGRWTKYLVPFKKVYCIDLNPEMLTYMADRFQGADNLEYVLTSGVDMPGIPENSVDFAFTYGVFVHLDLNIIEGYLKSLTSVLKNGALFVVQFSDQTKTGAQKNPGFSDNDLTRMSALLKKYKFTVLKSDAEMIGHSSIIVSKFGK